jgi:hypothetical protein
MTHERLSNASAGVAVTTAIEAAIIQAWRGEGLYGVLGA